MRKLLSFLILSLLSVASFAGEQFIVKDGRANAQIVIAAENRPRMATLAALELQHFIQKISGARLPIVTTPDSLVPVKIYVGKSPETEKLGVKTDDLKYGSFRVASGNGWLALVGDDRDFVPPLQPWPTARSDREKAIAAWKKLIESKTDAAWAYPFLAAAKSYWNPKDFDKAMDSRYGEGTAALWKTGGNTIKGFYEQDENGSLNAAHDFLRELGVRLYMAGEENEIIPKMASIPLKEVNKTSVPDYAFRNWNWYSYPEFSLDDMLWARRIGMNSMDQVAGPIQWVHGLVIVHASEECKKNHPDFYAIIGGKRDFEHKGHGSACFSSEGLEKEAVKYIKFVFEDLKLNLADIWPGDGLKPCDCEKCRGKTPSELVWGFANRVATELYKTHPDKIVSCGAYTSYIDPPDTIEKFSPNLAVWISNSGRPKMMDPDFWNKHWTRVQKWQSKLAPGRIFRSENNRYHILGIGESKEGKTVRGAPIAYPII
ncbi:MAG TPA: DUF4838 domain-containing protein, partial [Victivallales bacterium]|nr:DUF4838 domain-containing protein [Victivallales bacterium]